MSGWTRQDGTWRATAADAEHMRALGHHLAAVLRPGDVVVLDGPLGAGKTTLTQGIGEALGVRGPVTSPTFVIARQHPGPRVGLVHVDAYRLGGSVEVDDLDLEADLAGCVTVVEWGVGKVEGLAPDRLEVVIERPTGGVDGQPRGPAGLAGSPAEAAEDASAGVRMVRVRGVGTRWADLDLPAPL